MYCINSLDPAIYPPQDPNDLVKVPIITSILAGSTPCSRLFLLLKSSSGWMEAIAVQKNLLRYGRTAITCELSFVIGVLKSWVTWIHLSCLSCFTTLERFQPSLGNASSATWQLLWLLFQQHLCCWPEHEFACLLLTHERILTKQ